MALLALVTIYSMVSRPLRLGPPWLLPVLVTVLIVLLWFAHRHGRRGLARTIGLAVTGVGTIAVQSSIIVLVVRLIQEDVAAPNLLRDAALLWVTNVIIFAFWYWELDGGGYHRRHVEGYRPTDLAFPQIDLGPAYSEGWVPQFADYLFVAFTTSAAFGPTDTLLLSVRAKLLTMVQVLGSIVILAVIAARAINVLH